MNRETIINKETQYIAFKPELVNDGIAFKKEKDGCVCIYKINDDSKFLSLITVLSPEDWGWVVGILGA